MTEVTGGEEYWFSYGAVGIRRHSALGLKPASFWSPKHGPEGPPFHETLFGEASRVRDCENSRVRELSELLGQQLVHDLGAGLALGGFHDLAYEEAEHRLLAGTILFELFRVGGKNFVDHLFQR